MNMKPSANKYAKFQCRACGRIWTADQIYQDERSTAVRWTCGDLICGGLVQEVREVEPERKAEQQQAQD